MANKQNASSKKEDGRIPENKAENWRRYQLALPLDHTQFVSSAIGLTERIKAIKASKQDDRE